MRAEPKESPVTAPQVQTDNVVDRLAAAAVAVAATAAALEEHIAERAEQIAAARVAAVERAAADQIASVETRAAADRQRANDLQASCAANWRLRTARPRGSPG